METSLIATPVGATETGLVPNDLRVISDDLEGNIDLAALDFSYSLCEENEDSISGDTILERSKAAEAYGSLGFAKIVLDAQAEGNQVIPEELRREKYIICPRTLLVDSWDARRVVYLAWRGSRWVLGFGWLDRDFRSDGVVPRPRK